MGILAVRAGFSFGFLAEIALLPGPNSLGEAGKVFFANQVARGSWPFASGQQAPYYPSVHGFLLHALVGGMGAAASLGLTGLYYAGRAVSLAVTLGALLLFWKIGDRLTSKRHLLLFGLLLWAGSHVIFQHTTSFRPDNWVLALSLLACWLLSRRELSRASMWALTLVPIVAFHVKAPGVVLMATIAAGVLYRRNLRAAVGIALFQGTLLVLSIAGLSWVSDGEYLAGLGAAVQVDFSLTHSLSSLWTGSDPVVLILVGCPVLVGLACKSRMWRGKEAATVAGIFWAITLGAALLAAARGGSNAYYFLEPAAYGTLVGLVGLDQLVRAREEGRKRGPLLEAGLLVCLVPASANLLLWTTQGRLMEGVGNHSIARTERVGPSRLELAERLNTGTLSCFTDDPGLNVLLYEPRVIYPYLQTQMMESGVLPRDLRTRSIKSHDYDCVIVSGPSWSYQGTTALPESFFQIVREHYPVVKTVGLYEVRLPQTAAGMEDENGPQAPTPHPAPGAMSPPPSPSGDVSRK